MMKEKNRPQSPSILSISQTRALAQQHSMIDVAIASIPGQTIDPREAAAVSSGQLSMKSTSSRLDSSWRPEEHVVHEPEGRLKRRCARRLSDHGGHRAAGRRDDSGKLVRIVDGSTQSRYVCMFGVLCSGRTSGGAHAGACPSRAKLGERGPREQPKSDLMGKRGSSWGGGAARVKGPKREISAACDAPAAPWRPWTLGGSLQGGWP